MINLVWVEKEYWKNVLRTPSKIPQEQVESFSRVVKSYKMRNPNWREEIL